MTARNDTYALMQRFANRGITMGFDDANTLRRAEKTLHRWAELECGDGNNFASWSIERDEETDIPYFITYRHDQPKPSRRRIADKEKGALKRIDALCKRLGIYYYHQTDPRGCALYISADPVKDNDYNNGVSVCI
jgi:hypothetical protein